MANTCEKCQEVFYSDTEFREHKLYESLTTMMDRAANGSAGIYSQAILANILKYAEITGTPPNDAIEPYAEWAMESEKRINIAFRKAGLAK